MTVESAIAIRSVTQAVITARQAQEKGANIPISPCVKVNQQGEVTVCSNVDPKLRTLCTDPDGLIPEAGVLVCPKQRGPLLTKK